MDGRKRPLPSPCFASQPSLDSRNSLHPSSFLSSQKTALPNTKQSRIDSGENTVLTSFQFGPLRARCQMQGNFQFPYFSSYSAQRHVSIFTFLFPFSIRPIGNKFNSFPPSSSSSSSFSLNPQKILPFLFFSFSPPPVQPHFPSFFFFFLRLKYAPFFSLPPFFLRSCVHWIFAASTQCSFDGEWYGIRQILAEFDVLKTPLNSLGIC